MTAKIQPKKISSLLDVANSTERVSGYTHDFYNYPARFSPLLAREIIQNFTKAGDLVLDPFMGGGTTLIEAKLLNRDSVGFDISTLASFLSNVKLNPINLDKVSFFDGWIEETLSDLNCHRDVCRPDSWIAKGYQKNLSTKKTWPLRKLIEQFLHKVELSNLTELEKDFLRCVLLKTSQWALDSKKIIPNSSKFKEKIAENYQKMVVGSKEFWDKKPSCTSYTVNTPAYNVHKHEALFIKKPKLVLTSPPYPGIHVMYHRWQVFGKRETPAPFWIANSQDGHGLAHYTMGSRHQKGLTDYFTNIRKSFESISHVCDDKTIVAQVLAFSDMTWQLPAYLKTMEDAGFNEVMPEKERIWRDVPNRKWYAQQKGRTSSSQEVILFHNLAR